MNEVFTSYALGIKALNILDAARPSASAPLRGAVLLSIVMHCDTMQCGTQAFLCRSERLVNDTLDGEATETFSFRMSKALRNRLREAANLHRRTLGREIVTRLIDSLGETPSGDADKMSLGEIPASPVALRAEAATIALTRDVKELERRLAALEERFSDGLEIP